MMLYDHYGRYLWLLSDHTSCQLNVLLGKHTDEQRELIDLIVERGAGARSRNDRSSPGRRVDRCLTAAKGRRRRSCHVGGPCLKHTN